LQERETYIDSVAKQIEAQEGNLQQIMKREIQKQKQLYAEENTIQH
jgi:hypothetical protein